MRRISVFLGLAAIALVVLVVYTYKLRLAHEKNGPVSKAPNVEAGVKGKSDQGWHWEKHDEDGRPMVKVDASSFKGSDSPSTFDLTKVRLRLYDQTAVSYTYVRSEAAVFDEGSGVMKSDGPVTIIRNVPAAKDAEDAKQVEKLVRIETAGVTYETKTGRVFGDKQAIFHFPAGGGQAVGVDYDPAKKELHLKSQVLLDWTNGGSTASGIHVEAGDLVYKETEQKIYLSPWSKMKRQGTTIQAQNSVVSLQDGTLHQIDSDHAFGTNDRNGRHQDYSADQMTSFFDENGVMVNLVATGNARIISSDVSGRTAITSHRADLRFADVLKQVNGQPKNDSNLHLVLADGQAVAESKPLPQPNVQIAETRVLRSEHIELEMQPDGQAIKEIRTIAQGQLEFKPNREGQSHRVLDASRLRILYGDNNDIASFLAWNAATHTDKPPTPAKDGKPAKTPAAALTWSDVLSAKFAPDTNQLATIEQTGNFRYEEGVRQARSKKAFLEQSLNKITLIDGAHIWDDTGSTLADNILLNQQNGDVDASGHVVSSHEPDKNAKPGTTMLDEKQPMQARADKMITRENNTKVHYDGHATVWQGANRIAANTIDIDRDAQSLHAVGSVVSELVDSKTEKASLGVGPTQGSGAAVFTTVHAPDLLYDDDQRLAHYTGGVKLIRDKMTVTSHELRAFLNPKTEGNSDSSLDHAFADGSVEVLDRAADRTRTGTSDHCEYYPKQNKVILNGGIASMVDSVRGTTKGRQLTYFNDDDRLLVEGVKNELAFTHMKRK